MRAAALIAVALVAALGACGGSTPAPQVPTEPASVEAPATGPTEALEALLERVQSDDDYRGSGFRSGEQVTESFVAAVDELTGGAEPLPFDPFLCTQQLPRRIDYVDEQVEGETARVTAIQSYAPGVDETQTYDLVLEDGAWKLDRSECAG